MVWFEIVDPRKMGDLLHYLEFTMTNLSVLSTKPIQTSGKRGVPRAWAFHIVVHLKPGEESLRLRRNLSNKRKRFTHERDMTNDTGPHTVTIMET